MIQQLLKNLPPPKFPLEPGNSKKWQEIEFEMRIVFPEDYKEFVNYYGTGCVGDFLWVYNPFSRNKNLNLLNQLRIQQEVFISLRKEFEIVIPFNIFPDESGLLPWGGTNNGDTLFWQIGSDSCDDWKIVINDSRAIEFEIHEMSMTKLILKLLQDKKISEIVTPDLINKRKLFISST